MRTLVALLLVVFAVGYSQIRPDEITRDSIIVDRVIEEGNSNDHHVWNLTIVHYVPNGRFLADNFYGIRRCACGRTEAVHDTIWSEKTIYRKIQRNQLYKEE